MSDSTPALHALRLGGGYAVGWLFLVLAVVLGIEELVAGEGTARWAAVCACVSVACSAWVFGIRPRVLELPQWLEVRNPLRTVRVFWSSITEVDVDDVVRIHAGDEVVRCFALPRRDRRPLTSGLASSLGSRPQPEGEAPRRLTTLTVVERLEDQVHSLRGGNAPDGPPEVDVDQRALVAVITGGVTAVACVLLLVLG